MTKLDRKLTSILLLGIIAFSSILIYKIKLQPKYNGMLYNEVYSEYNEMFISSSNDEIDDGKVDDTIYILSDAQGKSYRVAGKIYIPKININYPIVYETTDEYLKIAPTKLFGPEINEVGNTCIAGHNYKNDEFFSEIKELEINDKVYLTNNTGKALIYSVYDKYEVDENDLTCTSQKTNGNIETTLITCTTIRRNRLIVKCRAINSNKT